MASTLTTISSKSPATTVTMGTSMDTPRTPTSKLSGSRANTALQTPSPGNWRHPRMAEIVRRRKTSTFDASNILRIVCNVAAFSTSFAITPFLRLYLPFVLTALHHSTIFLGSYQTLPLQLLRVLFLYNVYQAARPSWAEPDHLSDIALTPSQRRLLGLDPGSGKPNTPKTEYVTPPKYKRSTPRSQSPAWSQGHQNSEFDVQRGPETRHDSSSSNESPLWLQTVRQNSSRDAKGDGPGSARTTSLGFDGSMSTGASPSRESLRESSGIWIPSTPTPNVRGTGASVGLNSKWLYERGRSSSGSRKSFGGL